MSYVSHVAGQSRIFDYLYDPLFQASDYKDVSKANNIALAQSAPIYILSNYGSMFSDMPRRPSLTYWKPQNPLPHFPYKPEKPLKFTHKRRGHIDGKDVCKYFHVAPSETAVKAVEFHLDIPEEKILEDAKKFQNVGCQTLYRESSAQTHPYLPDAVIAGNPSEMPEIVRVSNLIGTDTQPGEFETKIIERARRRREWEQTLPEIKSMKDFEKRRIVLEAFEWEQWMSREDEIDEYQRLRYELVQRLFEKREEYTKTTSSAKIQNTTQRIEAKREKLLNDLRHKRARQLRKLEMKRKKITKKYRPVDVLTEHVDLASDLYAPQMRFGVHPKRRHFVPYKPQFTPHLEDLELCLKAPVVDDVKPANLEELVKPKERAKEIVRGFSKDHNLKKLYETLQMLRSYVPVSQRQFKCVEETDLVREDDVKTPIGIEEDVSAEEEYQSCIFLQKLIKGRAIQNVIYAGRHKCRGLIEEIQSTHQISSVSAMYPGKTSDINRRRAMVLAQRQRLQEVLDSKQAVSKMLKGVEAPTIGFLLDFLQRELQRLYEQRREHAWAMLVECERMKREADEARRRLDADRKRREREEIYRNVLKASYDTVTLYLENILVEEVERKAVKDAKKHVQEMVRRIDLEAGCSTQREHESKSLEMADNSESIITSLLKEFVFPEVQKRLARQRLESTRQHHLLAAHRTLFKHVDDVFRNTTPRSERSEITSMVLNNLIDKAITSDGLSSISEISSRVDTGQQETIKAIRKIIQKTLPESNENKERLPSRNEDKPTYISSKSAMLNEIVEGINERLWELAIDEVKENSSTEEFATSSGKTEDPSSFTSSQNTFICKSQQSEEEIEKLIDRDESDFDGTDELAEGSTEDTPSEANSNKSEMREETEADN